MALGANANLVNIIIRARDQTRAAFAKAKTSIASTNAATGKLNKGLSGLNGGFSRISSSLSSFGVALGPVGIAVAAVGVAIATLGGGAIKSSLEFEKATATIRVGTGATGESLIGLEASLKTVFTAVPSSLGDASTAIADLNTRLGLTGAPLEALASQFLNLSRITGTDVSSAISSATRVMHDFAVSSEEQAGALDYLFKVSQSTGIGMENLANNMTRYGGVMRQMGFDINSSAALLGKFEKEGVNLELVLSSLRMGLANFARAGEEPVDALQRVITEIQGMGSSADRNLKAIEIFGARSGPDMAAAIHEGRFSIEELMGTLEASSETINKAAADTMTFGDKWTLFKNKVMTAIKPIGDVITNVLGTALSGLGNAFGALQKIASLAIDIILLRFKILYSFLEGLFGPIIAAIAPLKGSFDGLSGSVSKLNIVFDVLSDIVTIITGVAKMLGTAIGTLVARAITPLIAKLQEAGEMLGAFYDKLGPLKSIIEGIKGVAGGVVEGFSNLADSFKEAVPPIEEVDKALEKLAEEGPKAPKAVADAWALAIKSFQEGTGSYKEAISGIEEKITEVTEEWMTATDKRKTAIEKEVRILEAEEDALEDLKKTAEDALSSTSEETEEATKKMEEFTVTIGDTTIAFKDAAAEVINNADAYEKLQDSARKIMDLDWSVFTEFEASLPNIEVGIGDMESSFVGLKDILEDNIGALENVKESVMDISEIAAPFLESGFLAGIKAIGDFAGALSDAGGAINTFAGLQEVSIEGCINFSLHVRDMVSALEILESQMKDLVPSFAKMDSLITDIADAFLYSGGRGKETQDIISSTVKNAITDLESQGVSVDSLISKYNEYIKKGLSSNEALSKSFLDLGVSSREGFFGFYTLLDSLAGTDVGYNMADEFIAALEAGEDLDEWGNKYIHTADVITHQMDVQTNALKDQTGQLSKITDAIQPYLAFMRTLNELAALSTLSTDDLNNGLNAINDTLINLGTSLSTFDLRPVMESLFGTKITEGDLEKFTGGIATGFTDVMTDYQTEFNDLIVYVTRLSDAINGLVSAFDSLTHISESVLSDQTKLKALLGEITVIMTNFSKAMGESGFAKKLAEGFAAILESAKPLIIYFQANNAAIELFNSTLTTFKNTISNVVDTMGMLKDMSEMVLPSVDELEAGFDKAAEHVQHFEEALMLHVGAREGQWDMDKYFNSVFRSITDFAGSWDLLTIDMEESFETFDKGTATIITLVSSITSLVEAFQTLADMPLITSDQIVEGFEKIKDTIEEVNKGMKQFAAEGISELVTSLASVAKMWLDWDEKLGDSDSTFGEAVTGISALVNAITDLLDVQKRLVELEGVSDIEWLSFFDTISKQVDQINKGMRKFGTEGVNALTNDLAGVEAQWGLLASQMGTSLTSFDDASSGIGGLADSVFGLVGAFTSLAEMPVMTAEAFSASMKDMSKNIENFASALKDNIATIEKALEAVDEAWSDYADDMAKLVPIFKDATDAINTLAGGIMSVVRSFESLKDVKFEEVFATGFENLTNATGEFATALKNNIDGLLTSLNALVNAWLENEDETVKLMRAFITISSNFVIVISHANALQGAFSSMDAESDTLGEGFKELTAFMKEVIKGVQELYTADVAADLAQFVIDVGHVIDALAALETSINTAMDLIHTKIETTVNDAKNKVSELSNIPGNAYTWGANIIYSFVNGMKAMEFYLKDELVYLADLIAFYLGVGSNTKLGALSHLTDWPKNLTKTFADGIKKGTPEISEALSSLTLPAENLHIPGGYAGMLGGGGNTVTMYNTWNVGNQHDADYAIGEIETMLTRKKVL